MVMQSEPLKTGFEVLELDGVPFDLPVRLRFPNGSLTRTQSNELQVDFVGGSLPTTYLKLDQTSAQTITASPVLDWLSASQAVLTDANKKLVSQDWLDQAVKTISSPQLANLKLTGGGGIYPSADSTTALYINKADNATHIVTVDTTNSRVGIGVTPVTELDISRSSTDTFTNFGNYGGIRLKNTNNTNGNYTAILNQNSAGSSNAQIAFKNIDHAYAAAIDFATRSTLTEYGIRMRINELGNVGIGTTAPNDLLQVGSTTELTHGTNVNVSNYSAFGQTGSDAATIIGHNVKANTGVSSAMVSMNTGYYGQAIKMYYNEGIAFHTVNATVTAGAAFTSERMRLTNAGNLRFSTAPFILYPAANSTTAIQFAQADLTPFVTFDTTNKIVTVGGNIYSDDIFVSSSNGSELYLTRNAAAIASGTHLGLQNFAGTVSGVATYGIGASIEALGDGLWTSTSWPSYIEFNTVPAGSTTLVQRMKIDSVGNVGIGTTAPVSLLTLLSGANITPSADSTTALGISSFAAPTTNWVTFDTTNKNITIIPTTNYGLILKESDYTSGTGGNAVALQSNTQWGWVDCYVSGSVTAHIDGYLHSYVIPTMAGGGYGFGVGIATPTARIHQDSGTATATYHKFTAGTTTGVTATDGFDVGIDASGNAELRQRENLPLYLYTNNTLRATLEADGDILFAPAGTQQFQLRDSAIGIYSQADTFLDLFADGAVRIGNSSAGAPTTYLNIGPEDTWWVGSGSGLPYGSMYMEDGSTATTLTLQNVAYPVAIGFTGGSENNTTFQNSKEIKILKAGIYKVDWSLSISVNNSDQTIEGKIMGGASGTTELSNTANATRAKENGVVYSVSGTGLITCAVNDLIRIGLENETSAGSVVTTNHANLTLVQIGG